MANTYAHCLNKKICLFPASFPLSAPKDSNNPAQAIHPKGVMSSAVSEDVFHKGFAFAFIFSEVCMYFLR